MEHKRKWLVRISEEEVRKLVGMTEGWRLESARYDVEKRQLYLEWITEWRGEGD